MDHTSLHALKRTGFGDKLVIAFKLLKTDPKIWLMLPTNASFGFAAAFLTYYVNGKVTKPAVGEANIGYLTAIIAALAAALSMPLGAIGGRIGKVPLPFPGGRATKEGRSRAAAGARRTTLELKT